MNDNIRLTINPKFHWLLHFLRSELGMNDKKSFKIAKEMWLLIPKKYRL